MWDEEKLDGFYINENLMKREKEECWKLKRTKEETLDDVILLCGYELGCLYVARLCI
jgi:hypothetical protein